MVVWKGPQTTFFGNNVIAGAFNITKPILLLSSSLGTTMDMWEPQLAAFAEQFRVLRYDTRGHGGSDAPPGSYSLDRLGRDVVELLDALNIRRVHFCGLSLGGMVGQWLALRAPERINRLVLAHTSAFMGPPSAWDGRIAVVREKGMAAVADASIERWFTAEFVGTSHASLAKVRAMLLAMNVGGYTGCCAAIRDMDLRRLGGLIDLPALVIGGHSDLATPPAHSEAIADSLRGSELHLLSAAHLGNMERPAAFVIAVLNFLTSSPVEAGARCRPDPLTTCDDPDPRGANRPDVLSRSSPGRECMKPILTLACTVLAVAVATPAFASEKGGGAYPNGSEALAIAALPPPGDYLINYSNYYNADRLNDSDGHSSVPDFSIDAFTNVFRYIHVTDRKILGASWAQQVLVPVVDLTVHAAGQRGHRFGVGDVIVTPFILGWHFKNNWHVVAAVETFVPTGGYNKNDLANIGRNYWTFEPVLTASHFNPAGGPEVSVKLMYDFNTRNKATDYRTGQEFHTDFAVAYNFNPVTVGLSGYYYKQTTDDKQNGVRVGDDGYKGETLALGPVVRYQAGKVPISFQYQHEMFAHNRPQGNNFWLKAAFRF